MDVSWFLPKFSALVFYLLLLIVAFDLDNENGAVQARHRIYPKYQSLPAVSVKHAHRTGYHFQPPKHWINGMSFHMLIVELFPWNKISRTFFLL